MKKKTAFRITLKKKQAKWTEKKEKTGKVPVAKYHINKKQAERKVRTCILMGSQLATRSHKKKQAERSRKKKTDLTPLIRKNRKYKKPINLRLNSGGHGTKILFYIRRTVNIFAPKIERTEHKHSLYIGRTKHKFSLQTGGQSTKSSLHRENRAQIW